MKRIGIIGLGSMGLAMAKNIIDSGFALAGFDVREESLRLLEAAGGEPAGSAAEVGADAEAVFVMVLNGRQVREVVAGENGLLETMKPGSTIIVTATIDPAEIEEIAALIAEKGIEVIDSPVSGGKGGAEAGTLTLMAAAKKEVFETNLEVLEAVGEKIFHVGEEIGMGQTVKASLQALIGATFTAIFESLVLGAKAGVKGEVMYEVFTASGVRSPLLENCAKLIMDRAFKDTGSQITTMYKDLGISMNMAKQNGVAMFTTSAAYELFQSGMSLFPEEDNWSIVKLLEQIAGTEVTW
ncbi:MAG: NAD(P)-dependent oxidoreductase [Acidobacteria bacterium]|nr:MAG: NAD(P)-dependent oxidoreductase [Acidobacteriota bacterium]